MHGVVPAVPTPVREDLSPDLEAFLEHARFCLDAGCHGLNVLGTTGEATSLPIDARRAVMKAAAEGLPGAKLMVGTGVADLPTTIALTRTAHEYGFSGALVLPPFYYKDVGEAALVDWLDRLVAATASTPIPIYLYNFPKLSGLPWSVAIAREAARRHPERIVGAKDSSGDRAYALALTEIEGFRVFPSDEGSIPDATASGFAGCISASVNVSAAICATLWAEPGDAALAERARGVRKRLQADPLIPAAKVMVAHRTGNTVWRNPLPPHMALDDATVASLVADIDPLLAG